MQGHLLEDGQAQQLARRPRLWIQGRDIGREDHEILTPFLGIDLRLLELQLHVCLLHQHRPSCIIGGVPVVGFLGDIGGQLVDGCCPPAIPPPPNLVQ